MIGRCGKTSCSFPAAIRLPVNVSPPRITSIESTDIMNLRNVRRAQIELGGSDQRDAQSAESMAEGGPLRHCRHLHDAERDADARAEHERDDDPLLVDDAVT